LTGTWVEIERPWHDTAVTQCALCGRLVPRRIWMVEIDGQSLPFCNDECEGLYRSYWLPKYGAGVRQNSADPTHE
jgi:ribosomal protein L24E